MTVGDLRAMLARVADEVEVLVPAKDARFDKLFPARAAVEVVDLVGRGRRRRLVRRTEEGRPYEGATSSRHAVVFDRGP